jgi:hypothetical protein
MGRWLGAMVGAIMGRWWARCLGAMFGRWWGDGGRDGGRDNGGRFFLGVLESWSLGVLESATVPSTPPIHIQ